MSRASPADREQHPAENRPRVLVIGIRKRGCRPRGADALIRSSIWGACDLGERETNNGSRRALAQQVRLTTPSSLCVNRIAYRRPLHRRACPVCPTKVLAAADETRAAQFSRAVPYAV